MIYSVIMFLNEFHLLDLHIEEELEFVDKIIIVEANQTFTGVDKQLLLKNNPKYQHPKIDLVFIENQLNNIKGSTWGDRNAQTWENEFFQRDYILNQYSFSDQDIILYSDCDEIHRRQDLPMIIEEIDKNQLVKISQKWYLYKINLWFKTIHDPSVIDYGWCCSVGVTGRWLKESKSGLAMIRNQRIGTPIFTGGKHFNNCLPIDKIPYKIESFSHTELNREDIKDLNFISSKINNYEDFLGRKDANGNPVKLVKTEVDESYPIGILNNLHFWKEYIA